MQSSLRSLFSVLRYLKGTPLHPQWLSDRYHMHSQRAVDEIEDSLIINIGSGDSKFQGITLRGNKLIQVDYPSTNLQYRNKPDVYADASCLPLREGCADVVLLLEVLEHIPDPENTISEAHNALKTGGKLYLSTPFLYPIHDAPHDYQRYTIYGLRKILTRHGFSINKELRHGNSIVTSLQLLNLTFLEIARDTSRTSIPLGLIIGLLVYLPCIAINLMASPFINLRWNSAGCFGYFIIAQRN